MRRVMSTEGDRWLREKGDALGEEEQSADGMSTARINAQRNCNYGLLKRLALAMIGGSSLVVEKQEQVIAVTAVNLGINEQEWM
ncbi:hypothetical protein PTKIN_Ptkin09bG0119000 [Pterospermum kingtungense]